MCDVRNKYASEVATSVLHGNTTQESWENRDEFFSGVFTESLTTGVFV